MGDPQPWRISLALDIAGLYDPELSAALDVPVGEVDRWEEGMTIPSSEQLVALASLTKHDVGYFFTDEPPPTRLAGFACASRRCIPLLQEFTEVRPGVWKLVADRPDADRLPI